MRFFSGFGFNNESNIFSEILGLYKGEYNVAGFSFGAQKALDFALDSKIRINELILLSPAFFNDKDSDFKRAQIEAFDKNPKVYMNAFLKNAGFKKEYEKFLQTPQKSDLEQLLFYEFKSDDLRKISESGVNIDVYLGQNDKIIDAKVATEFFKNFANVYILNGKNHFLKA